MGSTWNTKTIAECASKRPYSTQIGPFGKALTAKEYTKRGIPVLRGNNVKYGRFHDDDFVFIDEKKADLLSKYESFPGDVLTIHKGTLGQIGLMPSKRKYSRYIMGNSMLRVQCNQSILLPEYLYYWFLSPHGQHYLFSRVSQVGVPQIQRPLTTLREAELPIPPLPEQHAIAHVLGTLDDKIELNRRMNETLEAIARALFKSWFVNFDPVRAKMRGEKPAGMDDETAELFPDELVRNEELGKEVPKGWGVGKLGDVAKNIREGVNPDHIETNVLYIGLEHMPKRSISLSEWESSEKIKSNKFRFSKGDILFGKLRPYFHKVGIAPIDGICSTDIVVINAQEIIYYGYLIALLSSDEFVSYCTAISTGTKMPRTKWKDMRRYQTILPPEEVLEKYNCLICSCLEKIESNIHEASFIANVCDTLLPKLISGDVRIGDPERFLAKRGLQPSIP